jgi:actin related protein 2/3 complex, subunit 1A/1B
VFLGHDSSISIVYSGGGPAVVTVKMNTLPLVTLAWTAENAIVAAGHDCQPVVFSGDESGWRLIGSLDDTSAPKSSGSPGSRLAGGPGRLNSAAFNTFRNADSRGFAGVGGGSSNESDLFTVHQNTITSVRPFEGQPGAITRVSTSGVDGKLVIWSTNSVSSLTAKLGSVQLR